MSRILQLVTRDTPGGVRVLARMVELGLVGCGHTVTTLALRDGPLAIAGQIRTGGYDAIFSYQVAASLVGSLAGWLARVPIRATHLTALPPAMHLHWRWLDLLWGRIGLHTTIIANSTATLQAIAAYPTSYRCRVQLIPHGVAPLPVRKAGAWRSDRGIAPMAPLLVSSGRLVPQKNHATAVAALAQLPVAHLAIAGAGDLATALLRQASELGVADRLHLLGDLDPMQLASLLAASDIYLFPSIWESFGLAVVEAAMLGLPVVASDLPVLREVLAPAGILARFHAPLDATALARSVTALIDTYPTVQERRRSAQATTRAHAVGAMIDTYCRLVAGAI